MAYKDLFSSNKLSMGVKIEYIENVSLLEQAKDIVDQQYMREYGTTPSNYSIILIAEGEKVWQ